MNQKITGFHKDEENHWVADLECGHAQHVRHDPPWMYRPWTQTQEGRNSRLGMELDCVRCDELGAAVAESVRALIGKTVQEAYENAGISGLCAEGRWDVTMDSLRALDLKPSIVSALRPKTS
jgi:hypothetical protein